MRRSFNIVLVILILFALGGLAWRILHLPQTSYRGATVNFWVRSLTNANPEQAEKALEEIGLPALPFLLDAFENKDRPSARLWARLWNNAPAFAHIFMPKPFPWASVHGPLTATIGFIGSRHRFSDGAGDTPATPELERAVQTLARSLSNADVRERASCAQALAFIGPNAKNASPSLIAMFSHGTSKEKIFACQAIGTIGPCSTAQESARAILSGLESHEPNVIRSAADALGGIGPQAVQAVPALVKLIANGDEDVRRSAVRALARIGDLPNDSRPRLLLMLNETNVGIRAGAAIALLRLNSNEALATSVVEDCLTPEKPANMRSSTIYLMIGSKSLSEQFLPDLQRLQNDTNVNVATLARKALKPINTGAATKASAK